MKNESGVSSVVGVVLLLLLVIVASSIMAVVLSTATNEAVDSTPNAMFTISDDPQILYHGGGDVLYKN
ncbi:MAG TPA: type IV pilin, partial [Methanocorpusculum sp.]|nr:type IV pilin [Methanocorpusculum sp.]